MIRTLLGACRHAPPLRYPHDAIVTYYRLKENE
jgi:hypothetical protein